MEPQESRSLGTLRAILYGALVVGGIDFAFATIWVFSRGRPWYRAWQGVASAVVGPDSFNLGYRSVLLGVFLHFCVAACIVTTYLLASRLFPILTRAPLLYGIVFGVIAFFVMNLVVIPLSRIGPQPFVWTSFAIVGLVVHALLLGPAAAYFASKAAVSSREAS